MYFTSVGRERCSHVANTYSENKYTIVTLVSGDSLHVSFATNAFVVSKMATVEINVLHCLLVLSGKHVEILFKDVRWQSSTLPVEQRLRWRLQTVAVCHNGKVRMNQRKRSQYDVKQSVRTFNQLPVITQSQWDREIPPNWPPAQQPHLWRQILVYLTGWAREWKNDWVRAWISHKTKVSYWSSEWTRIKYYWAREWMRKSEWVREWMRQNEWVRGWITSDWIRNDCVIYLHLTTEVSQKGTVQCRINWAVGSQLR